MFRDILCFDVNIIALKCIPIGVISLYELLFVITFIVKPKFFFIFMSYCLSKVKHTVYWTIKPSILIKEWFVRTTKTYVFLFVSENR